MKRLTTAMLIAGLIFTQIQSGNASIPLQPAQLKNLAPGRYKVTLLGVSNMTVTLHRNGTIFGVATGATDTGYWKLSGDQICIAWNKWLGGSAHCSELVSEAGYYQGSGFTVTPI